MNLGTCKQINQKLNLELGLDRLHYIPLDTQ